MTTLTKKLTRSKALEFAKTLGYKIDGLTAAPNPTVLWIKEVIILTIAWIRGLSVEENIIPKKENLVKGKLEKERQQR